LSNVIRSGLHLFVLSCDLSRSFIGLDRSAEVLKSEANLPMEERQIPGTPRDCFASPLPRHNKRDSLNGHTPSLVSNKMLNGSALNMTPLSSPQTERRVEIILHSNIYKTCLSNVFSQRYSQAANQINPLSVKRKSKVKVTLCQRAPRLPASPCLISHFNFTHLWFRFRTRGTCLTQVGGYNTHITGVKANYLRIYRLHKNGFSLP